MLHFSMHFNPPLVLKLIAGKQNLPFQTHIVNAPGMDEFLCWNWGLPYMYVVCCTCIATVKYCAKHWMKGDVRDLGLIQSWILGSFSHIGSNFVTKGGFSGAADTNQALSRNPFDHALDSPFLSTEHWTTVLFEVPKCQTALQGIVKFGAARELFPPPECESCVYRLQQPCLLFLVIPPFTGRRIGTYEHGIYISKYISKYLSQKYQLFHQ